MSSLSITPVLKIAAHTPGESSGYVEPQPHASRHQRLGGHMHESLK
jgi:hypothetical protein